MTWRTRCILITTIGGALVFLLATGIGVGEDKTEDPPLEMPGGAPATSVVTCPTGAIAHEVAYGSWELSGDVDLRVEVCVTREGDVDTYTYRVTNLDYEYEHEGTVYGIGAFAIPNPHGLAATSMTNPMGWHLDRGMADAWHWSVPLGSPGMAVGERVVFSFSVAGPTVATPLETRAAPRFESLPSLHTSSDALVPSDYFDIRVPSLGPQLFGVVGPVAPPRVIPPLAGCPDGHVAYDIGYGADSDYGNIRVEECVTRDGEVDTYTYTVTNISYAYPHGGELWGIGYFSVPNVARLESVSVTSPGRWVFAGRSGSARWDWRAPPGSRGISIGESAVFSFSTMGPTDDGPAEVTASVPTESAGRAPELRVASTGPVQGPPIPLAGCPEGNVAYDVAYGSRADSPADEIRVEECVTRADGVDTYTYTVTNLAYGSGHSMIESLGIRLFRVPNPALLGFLSVDVPGGWTYRDDVFSIEWEALPLSRGIRARESEVFSFSVAGPTVDGAAEVVLHHTAGSHYASHIVVVESTGPVAALREDPPLAGCPEGHIAYDVGYGTPSDPRIGELRIEECVTRNEGVDTYTYTVTNLSYVYPWDGERWGIGGFSLPNPSELDPLSVSTPADWEFDSGATDQWSWSLRWGAGDGIAIGESVVFSFSVEGPTEDTSLEALALLPPEVDAPSLTVDPEVVVVTTGPQRREDLSQGVGVVDAPDWTESPEECPDLFIESVEITCGCGWNQQQQYRCEVVADVRVRNQGEADAGLFYVSLVTDEGNAQKALASLPAGHSRQVRLSVDLEQAPCPVNCTLKADSRAHVTECDEDNNALSTQVCCE